MTWNAMELLRQLSLVSLKLTAFCAAAGAGEIVGVGDSLAVGVGDTMAAGRCPVVSAGNIGGIVVLG